MDENIQLRLYTIFLLDGYGKHPSRAERDLYARVKLKIEKNPNLVIKIEELKSLIISEREIKKIENEAINEKKLDIIRKEQLKKQEEYFKSLPSWDFLKDKINHKKRSPLPHKLKYNALVRDRYCCRFCGRNFDLEGHHVLPVMYYGKDIIENIVTLCYTCHKLAPDNPHETIEILKLGLDPRTYNALITAKCAFEKLIIDKKILIKFYKIEEFCDRKTILEEFEKYFREYHKKFIKYVNDKD